MDKPLTLSDFHLSLNSSKRKHKWNFSKIYLRSINIDGTMESLDYIISHQPLSYSLKSCFSIEIQLNLYRDLPAQLICSAPDVVASHWLKSCSIFIHYHPYFLNLYIWLLLLCHVDIVVNQLISAQCCITILVF